MSVSSLINTRFVVSFGLAIVLGSSAYAFAAANVVNESGAGDGKNTISGYTIGDPTYTLDSADPTMIASVRFSVTPTAGALAPVTVKAQLVDGGTWYTCAETATPDEWSCTTTGTTALAADQLRVVAAQ